MEATFLLLLLLPLFLAEASDNDERNEYGYEKITQTANTVYTANANPPKYMKVNSTGEASTKHSELMGIYSLHDETQNGFPVWKRRHVNGLYTYQHLLKYDKAQYLFVATDGYWGIGHKLDSLSAWIYLPKKDPTPKSPENAIGWNFWDNKWKIDNQVTVEALTDCEYTYREVKINCICNHFAKHSNPDTFNECSTNEVCTNKAGCHKVCSLGSTTKKDEYCYCKHENSGELSTIGCAEGNKCTSDGHCHFDYQVLVDKQKIKFITGRESNLLWTNHHYRIIKMPAELINSILFQPENITIEEKIELSSPNDHDATVYLALNKDQDGGLLQQLQEQGWTKKDDWEVSYGTYCDCEENEPQGVLQIWHTEIEKSNTISLNTDKNGATFVVFFSTDCDEHDPGNNIVNGNCFCKGTNLNDSKSARHCKTGQGCKHGSCYDHIKKMFGRK